MAGSGGLGCALLLIVQPLACSAAIVSSCVYDPDGADKETGWTPGTTCEDQQQYCSANIIQGTCEMYVPCCKWVPVPVGGASEVIVTPAAPTVPKTLCAYDPNGAEMETGFAPGTKCKDQQEYCVSYTDKGGCSMFAPCCKWNDPEASAASTADVSSASASTSGSPHMSQLFASWEDLVASKDAHGVTWEVLQQRCEPGAGPGQSQGGFISDGMPLRDVLEKDWLAVKNMETTHLELVAHLDSIWLQANPCGMQVVGETKLQYDVHKLPQNTLHASTPVKLELSCSRTRGLQQDILEPNDWNEGWNVQWTVKNGHKQITVGGRNSSAGLLKYTKLFGFYEGGETNGYRVDPSDLVAILTGNDMTTLLGVSGGSSGGGHLALIALLCAVVLVAVVVVYFVVTKRKQQDDLLSSSDVGDDGPE